MKLNRKVGEAAALAVLVMLGVGCSGVNTSGSVSPASFFLPGLIHAKPQPGDPTAPLPEPAPVVQVAQVR